MTIKKTKGIPATKNGVCLTPECGCKAAHRGLCRRCYGHALTLIKAKKTNWNELVSFGLAGESRRPRQNLFTDAFDQAKRDNHVTFPFPRD